MRLVSPVNDVNGIVQSHGQCMRLVIQMNDVKLNGIVWSRGQCVRLVSPAKWWLYKVRP